MSSRQNPIEYLIAFGVIYFAGVLTKHIFGRQSRRIEQLQSELRNGR